MNIKTSFIFDYETLSQNVFNCVVATCAYYTFEWDRFLSKDEPYTFQELISEIKNDKLDAASQVKNFGYKINNETLEFWEKQPKEVRDATLKRLPTDITIEQHIDNILDYTKNKQIKYWWSRSNTFDPIILQRLASDVSKYKYIDANLPFYGIRDIRTYIDAKFSFGNTKNSFTPVPNEDKWKEVFKQHNAIHDIAADILRLQMLTRIEHDLDEVYC